MHYARLIKKDKQIVIPIEVDGWLATSDFSEFGFSGYDVFKLRQYNNFDNYFTKHEREEKDIEIMTGFELSYLSMWCEIFNDHVSVDFERQNERMPITYSSDYEKSDQKESKLFMPKTGYYLPQLINGKIEFFFKDTLVPLETVPFTDREKAEARFEELRIPIDQLSGFLEPEIDEDGSAYSTCPTRLYNPKNKERGPFCIDFNDHNDFYRNPNTTLRNDPYLMKKKVDEKDILFEVRI